MPSLSGPLASSTGTWHLALCWRDGAYRLSFSNSAPLDPTVKLLPLLARALEAERLVEGRAMPFKTLRCATCD